MAIRPFHAGNMDTFYHDYKVITVLMAIRPLPAGNMDTLYHKQAARRGSLRNTLCAIWRRDLHDAEAVLRIARPGSPECPSRRVFRRDPHLAAVPFAS